MEVQIRGQDGWTMVDPSHRPSSGAPGDHPALEPGEVKSDAMERDLFLTSMDPLGNTLSFRKINNSLINLSHNCDQYTIIQCHHGFTDDLING